MVQLVSVAVPRLYRPPPTDALPPVIVSPEIGAVTPPSIWNTRLALLPLIVTPAAGPVIVSVPLVSVSSSWPPLRVIVRAVLNTVGSKLIVFAPAVVFAWPTAQRRLPTLPSSRAFVTVNVAGTLRSSSASRVSRVRGGTLRTVRWPGRANNLRMQERVVMRNSSNRKEQ